MFWLLKEVEKWTGKKIDRPRNELVSWQNKLKSGPFSMLFACANESTVRKKHNYLINKTSAKCHASVTSSFSKTKGSFIFHWTKDFQKIPLENWVFCRRYFLKMKPKSTKSITQQCFSCQKKSVCQKLVWSW